MTGQGRVLEERGNEWLGMRREGKRTRSGGSVKERKIRTT